MEAGPFTKYDAAVVLSAGILDGSLKGQDRAALFPGVAVVADGVSSSVDAERAAEIVVAHGAGLFSEPGLDRLCAELLDERQAIIDRPAEPIADDPTPAALVRRIVQRKRLRAMQSTLAGCRSSYTKDGAEICLEVVACGDSAVFVFQESRLPWCSLPSFDPATWTLPPSSASTHALPDDRGRVARFRLEDVDPRATILLCSDGLYDSFADVDALVAWTEELGCLLNSTDPDALHKLMDARHADLTARRADDDICFVWTNAAYLASRSRERTYTAQLPNTARVREGMQP